MQLCVNLSASNFKERLNRTMTNTTVLAALERKEKLQRGSLMCFLDQNTVL